MRTESVLRAPTHVISGGKLDELELLTGGLYSPADGYCLPSHVPAGWPAPIVLEVPLDVGRAGLAHGELLLVDPDGTPLAHVAVLQSETSDGEGLVYLAGPITALEPAEHPPARHLRITRPLPAVPERHQESFAAVFSQSPLPWQLAEAMTAASDSRAALWLIAVCGPQHHGRYTVSPLIQELEAAAEQIHGARAGLLVLPAGVAGASSLDRIVQEHILGNLGATRIFDFDSADAAPDDPLRGPLPSGTVVLFTGLSGSGKSTVARALAESIQQGASCSVALLDGDDVRRILSPGLGFSLEERNANIQRIGWVAALVSAAGGTAICAPIAPFDDTRRQVRQMAEDVGRFLLVHISTPLSECELRDRKGLYARARRGELKDFTGIDSPYEYPQDADVHLDTSRISVKEAVEQIQQLLKRPQSAGLGRSTLQPTPESPEVLSLR